MISSIWTEVFIKPIFNALIGLYNIIPGADLGVAIILLTILIRIIVLKPSLKATRAQKALTALQPEIQKLQAKFKNNKQQLAKATMALYKEKKVSPFSSCLPILIQMPFLIALFWVLVRYMPAQRFDLLYSFVGHPGSFDTTLFGMVNLIAYPKITSLAALGLWKWNVVLALIAGAAQFYQSKMMLPKTQPKPPKNSANTDKQGQMVQNISKQMTYFMTVFIVVIALTLPAGISLSWIATTLFAIGTQWYVLERNGAKSVAKS